MSLCSSCGKNPGTPLRCGQCKSTVYCSAECQRSDWPFHRRICKPQVAATPVTNSKPAETPKPPAAALPTEKTKEDESLDWYRHREWRPQDKQEFVPAKIEIKEQVVGGTDTATRAAGKSAWNGAETWEEKDMTSWARSWLETNLTEQVGQSGEVTVQKVSGDASLCFVRGKLRYLFDLEISLKVGNGEVHVSDFSDHEETPETKCPRDFSADRVRELKEWIGNKRQTFVVAYQKTAI